MKKKIVYIFRGVPGSGKSTAGNNVVETALAAGLTAVQCEADQFFSDIEGNYNFDSKKLGLAHKDCFHRFCQAVDESVDIITLTNTCSQVWEFENYKTYAEKHGYMVMVFVTEHRHQKSDIHDITPEVRNRMIKNFRKEKSIKIW